MTKEQKEKALNQAKERFDAIREYFDGGEFIQVVGVKGGEIFIYRFYNDGTVTER